MGLLLTMGLIACGGGDSSSTTGAGGARARLEREVKRASSESGSTGGKEKKPAGSSGEEGQAGGAGEAASFAPKRHHDSGGGSAPYIVKGGDNSIQEFGKEAGSSEFAAAATALHNFFDARAEGNWAAACEYMSKGMIESFEKLVAQAKEKESLNCGQILEHLTNPTAKQSMKAEAAQADVHSLRTEGEQAFLIYTAAGGTVYAIPMAKENGAWKVASLAGTPLS